MWPVGSEFQDKHYDVRVETKASTTACWHHDGCHDTVSEGVDGEHSGYDMIWPATQVCRRTVESGLGGHDDGASADNDGAENASTLL